MTLARLEIETRITAPSVCSVRGAVPSMPSAAPVPGVGAFVEYVVVVGELEQAKAKPAYCQTPGDEGKSRHGLDSPNNAKRSRSTGNC